MLKNCVFKVSVDTKKWMKAAGVRAVKTVAQAAIAGIGAAAALGQVDWKYVVSASVLAGVISILTSIAGIPEVDTEDVEDA
nr:holin [uncultured Mediterraneibacter sp.]